MTSYNKSQNWKLGTNRPRPLFTPVVFEGKFVFYKHYLNLSFFFRSYCDNTTSPKLLDLTEKLLREIFRFQARAYDKNQIKGRAHRRYVCGFKECLRQLSINKVKLMIIATDCEPCSIPGGLDEVLNDIKAKCLETKVPWVFSLERKKLGYILFKRAAVSCVGILSYDGAQGVFHELMECSETEKLRYRETMQLN